jgi:hypothetical protein
VRVDETGYEETDFEYEIVKTSQSGDTIVFSLKSEENFAIDYYFVWLDKNRGLGEWTSEYKAEAEIYVVMGKVSEYLINEQMQTKKKVKYQFNSSIIFYEDGTAVHLGRNDVLEYKEYPKYILLENERRDFFDDFGHIEPLWEIFNFHKVNSLKQITNFEENPEKITKSDIQHIKETCLILITPEQSADANEDYDPVMEWSLYAYDRKEEYEAKEIKSVDAEKRYLSFALADGEKIVIDTKKEQNGAFPPSALLYKKEQIPIVICISGESDEGNEMIKKYLQ